MGPKIAMAASGVLIMALVSTFVAFLVTGDDAVPTSVGGSLADLEMEDDAGAAGDGVAATDRSVERRPWLVSPQGAGTRLGLDQPPAPAPQPQPDNAPAGGPLPVREIETAAVRTPPPAGQDTQPAAPTAVPPPAPGAEAKAPPPAEPPKSVDDLMAMTRIAPTPAPAAPSVAPAPTALLPPAVAPATESAGSLADLADKEPQTPAPAQTPAPEPKPDELPSLLAPPENAPGAPRRFAAASDDVQSPAAPGGRPRLNEPRVPPTAKAAIAAPPPRYATLREIKPDTTPPPATSGAKVAVVIEGLGLSQTATEAAINRLPVGVTLAFSPYARNLKRWIDRAKAKGHEVLIEVPMESKGFPAEDPGPLGLLTVLDTKANTERLDLILKEAAGASGVYDAQGSKFRESEQHVTDMFTALKDKNLFYVQGRPGIRVGEATVPTATADVLIDERPFRAAVDARLDFAEKLAKYQGSSVAVMSAKPVSYERLALWIDQLEGKGVSLAPVSSVLIQ
jgi:polysaccharide deacetylase 2 family uncharacterized protein YibQ